MLPNYTTIENPDDIVRWFNYHGAMFARTRRYKQDDGTYSVNPYTTGWTVDPLDASEIIPIPPGAGAAIVTGPKSNNLAALDFDKGFDAALAQWPALATAPRVVSPTPDRGKIIIRLTGTLPGARKFARPDGSIELEIPARGANVAGIHKHGGSYTLENAGNEPPEFSLDQLDDLVINLAGVSIFPAPAPVASRPAPDHQQPRAGGSGLSEKVKAAVTPLMVFERAGLVKEALPRPNGEWQKIPGNAGLWVNVNGVGWARPGENIGGDVFEAFYWCQHGSAVIPPAEFRAVVEALAHDFNISIPTSPQAAPAPAPAKTTPTSSSPMKDKPMEYIPEDPYGEGSLFDGPTSPQQASPAQNGTAAQTAHQTSPQAAAAPRFNLIWIDEAIPEQPETEWIIEDLIDEESVTVMYGDAGSKKTYFALDMCVSLAQGAEKFGDFKIPRALRVLIIDEESGHKRMLRRLRQIQVAHNITGKMTKPLVFVSLPRVDIRKPEDVAAIIAVITENNFEFVLIDALMDIMPGSDENAVKETLPGMAALSKIAHDMKIGIEVIHHSNRAGTIRGSSAIKGGCDNLWRWETEDYRHTLTIEKSRETSNNSSYWISEFRGQPDNPRKLQSVSFRAADQHAAGPKLSKPAQSVVSYFDAQEQGTLDVIQDWCQPYAEKTIRNALTTLTQMGLVIRANPKENPAIYKRTTTGSITLTMSNGMGGTSTGAAPEEPASE